MKKKAPFLFTCIFVIYSGQLWPFCCDHSLYARTKLSCIFWGFFCKFGKVLVLCYFHRFSTIFGENVPLPN